MNLVSAARQYLLEILKIAGPGIKVMIFDNETLTSTSIVFNMSEIMHHEVYLCEKVVSLANSANSSARGNMKHFKCICFLRPTRENFNLLCNELKNPRYGFYYFVFTHTVSKQDLKHLAEADEQESVQEVMEMFSDYLALGPNLYSINVAPSLKGVTWRHEALRRSLDGLTAVLLSIKRVPIIRYVNSSEAAQKLAQSVASFISREASLFEFRQSDPAPILLIMDRREDPVTPLLTQWTYEAMMHELLSINNNRIDLSHVPDVSEDLKEVTLSLEFDDFLRHNLYANYGEIGQNIKQLMEEFQARSKEQHSKLSSIHDLKTFLENYPAFKRMSGTVAKHVAIVSELSRIVKERKLLEISECEQEMVCHGEDHNTICQTLRSLISNPATKPLDALRLTLLYALRYESHARKELASLIDLLHKRGEHLDITIVQKLLEFAGQRKRSQDLFGIQKTSTMGSITKRLFKELKGVDNVYTQHQPLLTTILEDLLRGRLKESAFPVHGKNTGATYNVPQDRVQEVIVFYIGGVTYEESFVVHQINQNSQGRYPVGVNVILGGTTVLNSRTFLSEVLEATSPDEFTVTSGSDFPSSNSLRRN